MIKKTYIWLHLNPDFHIRKDTWAVMYSQWSRKWKDLPGMQRRQKNWPSSERDKERIFHINHSDMRVSFPKKSWNLWSWYNFYNILIKMWKLCIICNDLRIFHALKNLEIRKNPENPHAWSLIIQLHHNSPCHIIMDGLMQERPVRLFCINPLILVIWSEKSCKLLQLTHCGLMMPYGDPDLGQHWLR